MAQISVNSNSLHYCCVTGVFCFKYNNKYSMVIFKRSNGTGQSGTSYSNNAYDIIGDFTWNSSTSTMTEAYYKSLIESMGGTDVEILTGVDWIRWIINNVIPNIDLVEEKTGRHFLSDGGNSTHWASINGFFCFKYNDKPCIVICNASNGRGGAAFSSGDLMGNYPKYSTNNNNYDPSYVVTVRGITDYETLTGKDLIQWIIENVVTFNSYPVFKDCTKINYTDDSYEILDGVLTEDEAKDHAYTNLLNTYGTFYKANEIEINEQLNKITS